jgi:uncharacterized protein (TIGR02453 family)
MPDADRLAAVRQELDYNLDAFKRIISHKDFKKYFGNLGGEKLSRPPKGYEADNPAVEFLKHKSFLAYHEVDDKMVLEKDYDKYIAKVFKAMYPLNMFLNVE